MNWERSKSSDLGRWERFMRIKKWQGGKGGRVMRRQSGRYPVLFEDGGRRVSPRFHFFVSDVNQ